MWYPRQLGESTKHTLLIFMPKPEEVLCGNKFIKLIRLRQKNERAARRKHQAHPTPYSSPTQNCLHALRQMSHAPYPRLRGNGSCSLPLSGFLASLNSKPQRGQSGDKSLPPNFDRLASIAIDVGGWRAGRVALTRSGPNFWSWTPFNLRGVKRRMEPFQLEQLVISCWFRKGGT